MATYEWQDLEHCYGPVIFLVRYTVCTDAFAYYYQLHLSQYYLLRQIKFDIDKLLSYQPITITNLS